MSKRYPVTKVPELVENVMVDLRERDRQVGLLVLQVVRIDYRRTLCAVAESHGVRALCSDLESCERHGCGWLEQAEPIPYVPAKAVSS